MSKDNVPEKAKAAFRDSGGFVLRTPLMPFAVLAGLGEGGTARAAWESGGDVSAAVSADREALVERVRELLADPGVREAIFVASPDLDQTLDHWLKGEDKDPDSTLRSILSYVTRMTARSTPFGLFAGVSTGSAGGAPALSLPPRDTVTRHTRLDYGFLAKVVQTVQADPRAQRVLTFVPNTSLYRAGARLRMAEARIDERGVRYHRVTFEEDEALAATLERARHGARLSELAEALTDDDITREEAEEYIGEIVASQLLVSDLGPAITGPGPVPEMVAALRPYEETAQVGEALAEADAELDALDADGLGNDAGRYRDLADKLRKVDPDLRLARLFQVDLARPAPGLTLGSPVLEEAYRAVDTLLPMFRAPGEDEISRFREAFFNRYEMREIPLAEALDEEIGVGFGSGPSVAAEGAPLLNGLIPGGGEGGALQWHAADHHRLRLLYRALTTGATSIELTDRDVEMLSVRSTRPLPDAFSFSGTVVAPSAEAVAAGDFKLHVQVVSGPSGVRLLGRFSHLDPDLEALVRAHVADEEAVRPDAVFAELVHLPEGRVGNVLARPVLRAYEIPFLGKSGAPEEALLTLDDLLVSVAGDRVIIRSKRLGREVIPRLSNAHAYHNAALAPYRFLASLQSQGLAGGLMWSWGPIGQAAPFLPRVTRGRLVLAKAEWSVTTDDTEKLRKAKTPVDRFRATQELREKLNLPRWVVIQVGDNTLPVDLDTVVGADLLAHEVRQRGSARLSELLPGPDELCVESPEGRYTHEFVVPLVRKTPRQAPAPVPLVAPAEAYAPGSEWLTAKLYGGKGTADVVLREVVAPLVAGEEQWFFIRYSDPDPHLRLRVHGDPARLMSEVLPRLHALAAPLIDDGRLWRVLLDTYRPEVERYGGPRGVRLCERIFHADSLAILSLLLSAEGDAGLDLRWRAALHGVDLLLQDLGYDLPSRQAAVRSWRDGLAAEHGATGANAKKLGGQILRRERDALFNAEPPPMFVRRSQMIAPVVEELRSMAQAGTLTRPMDTVAGSLTHMHVNRILRAAQRTQELVVYDLLDRVYSARRAREAKA